MRIDINPTDIFEWDIAKLWRMYLVLTRTSNINYDKLTQTLKYGIKVKIPIYYITNNWFHTFPQTQRAKIIGHNKTGLDELMNEIEERSTIMREIILKEIETTAITIPRTLKE